MLFFGVCLSYILLNCLLVKVFDLAIGSNALHWAVDGGRASTVEWLLLNGAEVRRPWK